MPILVTSLLDAGADVRAVSRRPDAARFPDGVEVVAGDLSDATTLGPRVFADVDRAFVRLHRPDPAVSSMSLPLTASRARTDEEVTDPGKMRHRLIG